jgi:hypothetical protein
MRCNSTLGLKNRPRRGRGQSEMFNWNRILVDLCWSMTMADPTCYSYCLAHRIDVVNQSEQRLVSAPRGDPRPQDAHSSLSVLASGASSRSAAVRGPL